MTDVTQDLARHIANSPAPEIGNELSRLLKASGMPENASDALQIFLNGLCEDYWHHAGGGTTLNAAQLKAALSKIDKHLRAALDEIESEIVVSNALQHQFSFPRPETGIADFARALVAVRGLQRSAATEANAIDHKNRG